MSDGIEKSDSYLLGARLGAVKAAAYAGKNRKMPLGETWAGITGKQPYTPREGTGTVGNLMASIANVVKGRGRFAWRANSVNSVGPTLAGMALGATAGWLPDARQERDVVETGPDGKEYTRRVVTQRTPGDRIARGISGAVVGGSIGMAASRGYVGRA